MATNDTLAGDAVLVEVTEGSVMVGGATVVRATSLLTMEFAPDGAVLAPIELYREDAQLRRRCDGRRWQACWR